MIPFLTPRLRWVETILLATSASLLCFLLLGSIRPSPVFHDVYLIDLSCKSTPGLNVRSGYLSLCASLNTTSTCIRRGDSAGLDSLKSWAYSNSTIDYDPIQIAYDMTSNVVNPYLIGFCLAFVLLSTCLILAIAVPFTTLPTAYEKLCVRSIAICTILWAVGAIWSTADVTAATELVSSASSNMIDAAQGTRASAMSWTTVVFLVLTIGLELWAQKNNQSVVAAKCIE